jgi:hypothetical protein
MVKRAITWLMAKLGRQPPARIRFRKYKVAPRLGAQLVRRRVLARLGASQPFIPVEFDRASSI